MSLRTLAPGFLACSAALLVGCGAPPVEDGHEDDVASAESAIKGGYEDTADTAVVGVVDVNAGGLCSGSLLTPNMVLTARHCVSNTLNEVNGGVACNQTKAGPVKSPTTFYVTTKPEFTQNPANYHAVAEVIGLPIDTNLFCGNDQAIIILKDNIGPEEAIPLVPRVDEPLAVDEQYYAVGYGAVNDSGSGAGLRRRRDQLFVSCVADGCPASYVKATEWVGDTGICNGDSGGPAIDLKNRVIGVTSRGSVGCDSPVYGYVLGWAQWIKDTAIHASQVGGYPAPPWATGWPTDPAFNGPVGDACTDPTQCATGNCVNDGVGSYCTRQCNELAPCPEGFVCDAANTGVCLQTHDPPPPADTPSKKKKKGNSANDDGGGCTIQRGGDDPTKPIPWKAAGVVALGLFLARRRRGR